MVKEGINHITLTGDDARQVGKHVVDRAHLSQVAVKQEPEPDFCVGHERCTDERRQVIDELVRLCERIPPRVFQAPHPHQRAAELELVLRLRGLE
jgi:hypothetical protein